MSFPPGEAGFSGPIESTKRAITPARLGVMRLGASRLGFVPSDVVVVSGQPMYANFRSDKQPGVYAAEPTFTEVLR